MVTERLEEPERLLEIRDLRRHNAASHNRHSPHRAWEFLLAPARDVKKNQHWQYIASKGYPTKPALKKDVKLAPHWGFRLCPTYLIPPL